MFERLIEHKCKLYTVNTETSIGTLTGRHFTAADNNNNKSYSTLLDQSFQIKRIMTEEIQIERERDWH